MIRILCASLKMFCAKVLLVLARAELTQQSFDAPTCLWFELSRGEIAAFTQSNLWAWV